jgi:hypothetical protein
MQIGAVLYAYAHVMLLLLRQCKRFQRLLQAMKVQSSYTFHQASTLGGESLLTSA